MTTDRRLPITPNASADDARHRPTSLPRRQRAAAAIASVVISVLALGGIAVGMTGAGDASVVTAGTASVSTRA